MTIQCNHCRKPIELGDKSWPADTLTCPHCGGVVEVAKAGTNIVELSPSLEDLGDARPIRLEADQTLQEGTLIGQYRISHILGKGGMGTVYKAVHPLLSREVAIKVLPPDLAKDPEFVRRFKREAMALAKLQHPNIVAVHDMGVQGEIYYFVMEFINGVNLRVLLHEKRLTPDQALHVVPKLCDALEYAHQRGIVHRDIKPENIMIDLEGVPKIADFGLAKILRGDSGVVQLTQTNIIMGTLDYMAPEQRDAAREVDHRADIYSMGVVLYEMLTGEVPIGKFDLPSTRGGIDIRLDDVVMKALEKDPARRYQRATHLGGDVTHILTNASPATGAVGVIDLKSGKLLARSQKRALGVELENGRLSITSWERPDVGLADVRGCVAVEERGCAILRFKDDGLLSVFVPRDIDMAIRSTAGDVIVNDSTGRVTVNTLSGDVTLNRFKGGVTIQSITGDVTMRDVTTGEMAVHLENGDVEIEDFKFRSGEAAISSKTGNVSIVPDAAFSSFTYDLTTTKGMITADAGVALEAKPHHVFGRLQDGAARLRVTAEHGTIRIGRGQVAARLPTAHEFWGRMPASFRIAVGKYVIICGALFAFFVSIGNPFVAGIVAIFWGMSLALKGWTLYNSLPPVEAPVVAPAPAAAPMPAPEPPKPAGPRFAAFTVFANLCVGFGILVAIGSMCVHWVTLNAVMLNLESEVDELHIASFSLMGVILGLAMMGLLFSAASLVSMMEAPGRLRGRSGAGFALTASLILGIYALGVPGRHLQKITGPTAAFTTSDAQAYFERANIKAQGVEVTWAEQDLAEVYVEQLESGHQMYYRFVRKNGEWRPTADSMLEKSR